MRAVQSEVIITIVDGVSPDIDGEGIPLARTGSHHGHGGGSHSGRVIRRLPSI